ncbi:hypothetical protein [Thermus sp. NMX2.A1]|uniref:hypothetical protein n=1 Tax=Thermus sp. NMX2.A1 TaxID=570924 RepID=UPI0003DCF5A8|nr:hypothetical protein [Thermus sp. NMX2.A1]ETN89434.1 hypothetical protein TNMX_02080 [Thermus sp. NMX2.A1]
MKKLILSGLMVMGLALAQAPYVGGHIGLFGGSGVNVLNGGIHAGAGLQGGLEVRGGVDFTSALGVLILGINSDLLINLGMPGSPVLPYGGLGGNFWFLPGGGTDFGVHATLGIKYPISGTPATAFLEFQPAYAFGGGGVFVYYLKVGANYGF